MTFTLSLTALAFIAADVVIFLALTILAYLNGLIDAAAWDGFARGVLVFLYVTFWLVPTLIAWGIWATWGPW